MNWWHWLTYSEHEKVLPASWLGAPFYQIGMVCWAIVGVGATWGVLSPSIRDTLVERVVLSMIAIAAFSRAYFVFQTQVVTLDALMTSVALAIYCFVIWWKHSIWLPRRRYEDFIERRAGKKS